MEIDSQGSPAGRAEVARHPSAVMQYSFGDDTRGLEDLTPPQQKAFAAMYTDEELVVKLSRPNAEVWAEVRTAYPDLKDLTDDDFVRTCKSYTSVKPTLADTLFKTPVGPLLLVNLLAFATDFSAACDLPWSDTNSRGCLDLAERRSAAAASGASSPLAQIFPK